MLAAPAGSRRTRRQVAGGTKKTPPKSAALLGSDCDLALGCQIQVLHVEVDGADLRAQAVGGHDAHREPMPRVAELRGIHGESPAAVQAIRQEWKGLQHVRSRETVLRDTDEVTVDDDLHRDHTVGLIRRPTLEGDIPLHIVG